MKDVDVFAAVKVLVTVSASAVTFYACGYIITRAYVASTGLMASFWFTESFYREAGARFLLDVFVAIALAPHVFIPLSATFLVLLPGRMSVLWRQRLTRVLGQIGLGRGGSLVRDVLFALVVALALALIVFELIDCGNNHCRRFGAVPKAFFTSNWLLAGAEEKWLLQQPRLYPMVIFLALAVPMALTLALWAFRMLTGGPDPHAKEATGDAPAEPPAEGKVAHPAAAFFVASAFVVLTFYIPIAYGAYFYDFVVVQLAEADNCVRPSAARPASAPAETAPMQMDCYLLGRFDDSRYVLLGSDTQGIDRKIYIRQVAVLEPFAIMSRSYTPLRELEGGWRSTEGDAGLSASASP